MKDASRLLGAALCLAAGAAPAWAQPDLPARGGALAARVAEVRDGRVRLTYPLRDDVCGIGEGIRVGPGERWTYGAAGDFSVWGSTASRTRDVEWPRACETGPGRLVLDLEGGVVRAVRVVVGGAWRPADHGVRVRDLGEVPPDQTAGLLLALAAAGEAPGRGGALPLGADPRAARAALFPATLARGVSPWAALVRLARDADRPRDVRRQALALLGAGAGEAATAGLAALADDPDREVRVQAVAALARRPADEAVPALVAIARTHRDPEIRRQAFHWLGRTGDPRALALFEELLAARR